EPVTSPDAYLGPLFGRSALDHHSAGVLIGLATFASENYDAPHLGLLASNPYRVVFLPHRLISPFATGHRERIGNEDLMVYAGSAPQLLAEVLELAPALDIPLQDGGLADSTAALINDFAPLYEGDPCDLAEHERTAWLVLHEAARLAIHYHTGLSLA